MSQTSKEYLAYLIGLAGIVATTSAYAGGKKEPASAKAPNWGSDWGAAQRITWYYEAFPESTFRRFFLRPGAAGPAVVSFTPGSGRMKARLQVYYERAKAGGRNF